MISTRLCIARHGETDWNVEQRVQGHTDIPLNTKGRAQAEALATTLADERFDAIYSSDLKRALETATPVATANRLPIQSLTALRERSFGLFEGLTRSEMKTRFPEMFAIYHRREPDFALPGGESINAFAMRVQHVLTDIVQRHTNGTVLIITHGGGLDVARRLTSGRSMATPRDYPLPNAVPAWIEYHHQKWTLIRWPEASA